MPTLGRLGLGTGLLGFLGPEARPRAEATIEAAFDLGIRHFDTAPFYGRGQAENWLGAVLRGRPRDGFVVSTKVGRSPVDSSGRVRAEFDFSRDSVLRSLEESLGRLGLDAVDILFIHDADDHWPQSIGEAYPAIAELRAAGVVKAIGAGMNQWQMLDRFVTETDLDAVLLAGRYTILEQTAAEVLLPHCRERGVTVIAGGVFNSGVLARDEPAGTYNYAPAPPEILDRARRLAAACGAHGITLPHAALAFVDRHPAITELLVGAESPEEVQRNARLLAQPVPDALWTDLTTAGLIT
jgi:D-threo-aldose 1-dehydrogenase